MSFADIDAKIATALEALDEVVKPLRRLSKVDTEMVRLVQEEHFVPKRFHRFRAWLKFGPLSNHAAGNDEPLRKRQKCDIATEMERLVQEDVFEPKKERHQEQRRSGLSP